jgi:amino acid transporter
VSIIFFNVCGGAYAVEDILAIGPGFAVLLMVVAPLVWSVPIALICAELGTAIPEEGGYYAWSKRALGPFGAFCQGWWAWLYTFIDIGLYPTMFCDYLAFFAPEFGAEGDYWLRKGLMLAMIWGFVALNLFGSRTVGGFARLTFALVLAPFVILMVVGLARGLASGFAFSSVTPLLSPGMTIGSALAVGVPVVLWNYLGWDSISTIAGEMEQPRRDYPRALLISGLLIAVVYVAPSMVALAMLGTESFAWTSGAWSLAAARIVGPWLGQFMSAMGMVSAIGLYSALVLVYSRVPFVMGRDGYLPKVLMRTNRWDAPWVSLIVSGVLYSIVILVFRDVQELASADVTVYGAMLTLELLSFLVLRKCEPKLERPFRVPGGWGTAILLCALPLVCLGIGVYYSVREPVEEGGGLWNVVGLALTIMASGPLLYPLAAWWRRRSGAHVRS